MTKPQVKKFDAEVGKVLHLMIHSLYTNKDIFLRELISNASDACDKLRYKAIANPEFLDGDDFKISVKIDKPNNAIIIQDNGIGMNMEDMVQNLGTIASSGTQKFLESLGKDDKKNTQLIGQFGVGFYSSFIVADEVTVHSTKAGEKKTFVWSSKGDGEYTISKSDEDLSRGTRITLKIKPSEVQFLERYKLHHIIHTYSDHIAFPIALIDDEDKEEIVNKAVAIWVRPQSEVSKDEYSEFYHHIAHSPGEPWMTLHNKVEGNIEYTNLLYIPDNKPFDLFHPDRKARVKLYVKRVFITDDGINLIPPYLRFLRGVVDSEDLPLNISRETLQNNSVIEKIRKSIVKRVISSLKKKYDSEPIEYKKFWDNFGEVIKEGLCEHTFEDKEQLLDVCIFHSINNEDGLISLDTYITNMVESQDEIFYLTGENIESLRKNPQLEGFRKRGIDVILLPDHVDNFWVNVVNQYKNKTLKAVTADINLDKIKKIEQESSNDSDDSAVDQLKLIEYIKTVLGDKIKDVRVSTKLVESPACLALPDGSMNIRLEKMLIEQKQLNKKSAKILEINPNHPIFQRVSRELESGNNNSINDDLIYIIFNQACLIEGEDIDNPAEFAIKLNRLLS